MCKTCEKHQPVSAVRLDSNLKIFKCENESDLMKLEDHIIKKGRKMRPYPRFGGGRGIRTLDLLTASQAL